MQVPHYFWQVSKYSLQRSYPPNQYKNSWYRCGCSLSNSVSINGRYSQSTLKHRSCKSQRSTSITLRTSFLERSKDQVILFNLWQNKHGIMFDFLWSLCPIQFQVMIQFSFNKKDQARPSLKKQSLSHTPVDQFPHSIDRIYSSM